MILVFGGNGQLGRELQARAAKAHVALAACGLPETDIADPAAVAAAIGRTIPTVAVNAAAYTAVDKAESEPSRALRANATGPTVLAAACARLGLPLIHISTDYVFDGWKVGAYREDDPVAPINVYGRTKLAGENAIRSLHSDHLILRTSWLYGVYGSNFLKTMLRLAGERDTLRVVADQRGRPTSSEDLADAILHLAPLIRSGKARWGTYHFAGAGETTWHGFASRIVAAQAPLTGRKVVVEPITTADFPTAARRPANSVLDSNLFAATFGFRARPWEVASDRTVTALLGGGEAV